MSSEPYPNIVTCLFPHAKFNARVPLAGGVSAEVQRLDLTLSNGNPTSVVMRAQGESYSGLAAQVEYQLLQSLHGVGLPVPEPLLVDLSGSLVAEPYVIMEFVEGTSEVPVDQEANYIERMADVLAELHSTPVVDLPVLPVLPERNDPLPEVFDYLPAGEQWQPLRDHLRSLTDTVYTESPSVLHGDFWPENLLWRNGSIAAILDWEDAALGDPLSDLACGRVELRYKFGKAGMQQFTQAYSKRRSVDEARLALWQVYVAAAAQRFMGDWGLEPAFEARMRRDALASLQEAAAVLMGEADW